MQGSDEKENELHVTVDVPVYPSGNGGWKVREQLSIRGGRNGEECVS